MKEIFFGWITKGQYQLSFLDGIIAWIEIFAGTFLLLFIICEIKELIDKFKKIEKAIIKFFRKEDVK